MKLFIDTANVDEIRKANDLGVICGVTTNPSLIAKEGRVFEEVVKEIADAVAAGKDVTVSTEIVADPIDDADVEATFGKADVEAIEEAAGNKTVAQYLNLSVVMNVAVNGNVVASSEVSELASPITFTIEIPEDLQDVEEGVERVFYVVRVHEGETTVLETTLNGDGTLSFETDVFSTYALAYEDTKDVPKTSDANTIMAWVALMAVAMAGAFVLKTREN